jgi:hypothetical protein
MCALPLCCPVVNGPGAISCSTQSGKRVHFASRCFQQSLVVLDSSLSTKYYVQAPMLRIVGVGKTCQQELRGNRLDIPPLIPVRPGSRKRRNSTPLLRPPILHRASHNIYLTEASHARIVYCFSSHRHLRLFMHPIMQWRHQASCRCMIA